MKVSQIPYERYTLEQYKEAFEGIKERALSAKCANCMLETYKDFLAIQAEYFTAACLSNCRFTLNTKDEYYSGEVAYYDEIDPIVQNMMNEYGKILLESPYRAELENGLINPRVFKMFEVVSKAFDEKIISELQEENNLITEYSKFMSEMEFEYNGEKMPLSKLRGGLDDGDRTVRESTCHAIGLGLQKNAAQLDEIYDKLVKVRDRMAKKLGYENYIPLGYYKMGRMDYDADMIAKFRDNVKESIVPCVAKLKEEISKTLGIDTMMFYDDTVYINGETPKPVIDKDGIFAAAIEMYDSMHPEVGAFMRAMQEAEAFDVESRDGKFGGGYCTVFSKYQQPFILANFNGSSGDVDVMTHEFGHALAAGFVFKYGDPMLEIGGMETAECHSMSMEFFSWKYMEKFFGDSADAYRKRHLLNAISFIPYGVIVDEFQHKVYENPNMTPAERNQLYLDLEEKYRPYLSWTGIPYLENGTRWQFQMHIYQTPFYYIDYCLAQTVALNFLLESVEDYDGAFERYLNFSKTGGQKAFDKLISDAGLPSPFTEGSLDTMAKKVMNLAENMK